MKKTIVLFLISLFILQSCIVNSEIVYHKDATTTTVTDIDNRAFMAEMKAMTPDSLKQGEFGEMDKLPTTWTSIYELEKQEGKLKTQNPDSIKIMKKIFMKSKKENNEAAGFAFKLEHFSSNDYQSLKNFTKEEKLPLDQNIFNNWDGKTLTISTENFNLKNLEEAIRTKSSKEEAEKMEGMMTMFFKKIETTLKFENKIKSITGKHDWLKQIDNYSVKIGYDLRTMYDKEAKFKNDDKKIIIVTE
ncbi:hypothetical protein [Chryseobacterium sp. PMSZPI]|uniref:hypothetical protein n=1 Tax=Chryseobacterium sp. PMSZPI TaxID=1033900 RepID=UPI000C31F7FE|nr:hypothetical protein [Chryseobacterium sp. PMSZPI]PKF72965.1 hypothetical protein CW752_15370 [Chryseobacterium sp. PMSZPI]